METLKKVAAHTETVSINDFIKLDEVFCQRNTQRRVNGTAKRLRSNPLPTHQAVVLGRYPNGKTVILDGNTRRLAWATGLASPPDYVFATIYDVANNEEAQNLYESLDSTDAVEKSSDKIYSAMKIVYGDMYEMLSSSTVKNGKITSALRYAVSHVSDGRTSRNHNVSWSRKISNAADVINYYKWELATIDNLLIDSKGCELHTSQAKLAAALLMLKAYGIRNSRLNDGLVRLFAKDFNAVEGTPTQNKIDAICWANKHLMSNPVYANTQGTDGNAMAIRMDYYVYFLELWMNGKKFADSEHARVGNERYAVSDLLKKYSDYFAPLQSISMNK